MNTEIPRVGLVSTVNDKSLHFHCAAEVYAGFIKESQCSIDLAVVNGGAWWDVEGTLVPLSRELVDPGERCSYCGEKLVKNHVPSRSAHKWGGKT